LNCGVCGKPGVEGARFCAFCGAKMEPEAAKAAPNTPPTHHADVRPLKDNPVRPVFVSPPRGSYASARPAYTPPPAPKRASDDTYMRPGPIEPPTEEPEEGAVEEPEEAAAAYSTLAYSLCPVV